MENYFTFYLSYFGGAKLSFRANWKVIADLEAGLYYYDAKSIKKTKTGAKVWTKMVFSKEGKRDFIKMAGKDFNVYIKRIFGIPNMLSIRPLLPSPFLFSILIPQWKGLH
jgi:hypothetical protein